MRLPAAHQTWSVLIFPCFVWVFSFVRRSWMFCFHFLSDVDECSLGRSHCSSFATCYNTPGSYKCKCKDGYRGMGHDCKRKSSRTKKKPWAPDVHFYRRGASLFPLLFSLRAFTKKVAKHKSGEKTAPWAESRAWNSFLCNSCQSLLITLLLIVRAQRAWAPLFFKRGPV